LGPSDSYEAATRGGAPGAPVPSVSVRCWGTRGSIPSPGPETTEYGGNTSCVEIRTGGTRIILDAGTGIRLLGEELSKEEGDKQAVIFLTHFHWDHIQGLPFFAPAHDPAFDLRIFGPEQEGLDVETLLAGQMGPIYFPVSLQELPASFTFSKVEEGSWIHENVQMRAMRMRHPSVTLGYRAEAFGRSIVFIPDNELKGGSFPTPPGWRKNLENFVRGADVLFHDAMFTEEEGPSFEGWGHSTFEEVVDMALRAEVRELFFFHHAPGRSDAELNRLLDRFRDEVSDRGGDLQVYAAAEGSTLLL
jgi:phosphoribosyl 1,2-cyclic phosphodiesterase